MTDLDGVGACVWALDTELGDEGAAALAGPLGTLVHFTSLDLGCTCLVCVACVMHAVSNSVKLSD